MDHGHLLVLHRQQLRGIVPTGGPMDEQRVDEARPHDEFRAQLAIRPCGAPRRRNLQVLHGALRVQGLRPHERDSVHGHRAGAARRKPAAGQLLQGQREVRHALGAAAEAQVLVRVDRREQPLRAALHAVEAVVLDELLPLVVGARLAGRDAREDAVVPTDGDPRDQALRLEGLEDAADPRVHVHVVICDELANAVPLVILEPLGQHEHRRRLGGRRVFESARDACGQVVFLAVNRRVVANLEGCEGLRVRIAFHERHVLAFRRLLVGWPIAMQGNRRLVPH
mmetsp:Transcript_50794/g.154504  ORF Transcript_50794/g.154504 Transcript_50794/m.154504 type:complete len:282 (+) Transcript_50794:425-1270(+)